MRTLWPKHTILFVALFLTGCGDDDIDLTAPTMEVMEFTPQPEALEICGAMEPVVFEVTGGDEMIFDVVFSDDVALSQYKLDIHNNFDCHGHGGGSAPSIVIPNVENQTEDWTVLETIDLAGTQQEVTWSLRVPDNVTAGNYHYHIQVVDASGNDSPFANFFSVKVKNPADAVAPVISVQQPANGSFSATRGERVRFVGQVTDDRSLSDGGNGVLYLSYTSLSTGNTFATDIAIPFDASVGTSFDFDFEYEIPQTITRGDYRLSLGANDGVRNVAEFAFFEVAVD